MDRELEQQYTQARFAQISHVSRHVLFAKLIYGCFVCLQHFKGTLGLQRNLIYQLALLAHYVAIWMQEQRPAHYKYHSSLSIAFFCMFMINGKSAYPDVATESMALMIGCQSAFYLAAAFLTYKWLYFAFGNAILTLLIILYYVQEFGLRLYSLAPSMIISSITCCAVAYFVELHDKKKFLDRIKIEGLQNDLNMIVQHFPEGVMIFERSAPDNVKLYNDQFVKLFQKKERE